MSNQQTANRVKRRPQARRGRTVVAARDSATRPRRTAWFVAAIVVAVGGALVFVFASGSHHSGRAIPIVGREQAPAALVSKVISVPTDVITRVGEGAVTGLPAKLPGPILATADGKPRIIYLGAEYCPYCATERWAMVQALSRFGTFSNLQITTSAGAPEPYPHTPTFSFHGASYTSTNIQFEPIEEQDNSRHPLDSPTSEQASLIAKYDAPPYVNGTSGGTIPFIDFANTYLISGVTYNPAVLKGRTHAQIAAALWDPSTDISQGVIGAANAIAATICKLTNNRPARVCTPVKSIVRQLG